jgi:hypothetical protein
MWGILRRVIMIALLLISAASIMVLNSGGDSKDDPGKAIFVPDPVTPPADVCEREVLRGYRKPFPVVFNEPVETSAGLKITGKVVHSNTEDIFSCRMNLESDGTWTTDAVTVTVGLN